MAAIYRAILVGVLASLLVFTFFPGVDLWATGLFYVPGEGFPVSALAWVDAVRDAHMRLAWLVGIAALALWLGLVLARRGFGRALAVRLADSGGAAGAALLRAGGAVRRRLARWGVLDLPPRKPLYILLCLALGPGLLVNVVLKDNWGRARPSQTVEFGGTKAFTPAFERSDQCPRNCSFVSGEASLGFWWLAFAFAAPAPRRRPLAAAALTVGFAIGLIRLAEGGHFLSDVVVSGLLTVAVCALLRDLMLAPGPHGPAGGRVGPPPAPV